MNENDARLQAEGERLSALLLAKQKEAQEAGLSDDGEIHDWIAERYPDLARDIVELCARLYAAAETARIVERLSALSPHHSERGDDEEGAT
jgi:hypothetical protein